MEPKIGAIYKTDLQYWEQLIFKWNGLAFEIVGPPGWKGSKFAPSACWTEAHRELLDKGHADGFTLLSQ